MDDLTGEKMFSETDTMPPKKLDIPWLGSNFDTLPDRVRLALTRHFEISVKPNNVSMLTESQIHTSIYYLNSQKYYQLDCALIICRNLNKKLIVIHHDEIEDYISDSPCVLFCIDLETKPANIFIEQVKTHFLHEHNMQMTQATTLSATPVNSQPVTSQEEISGEFERKLMDCLDHIQLNLHNPIKIETLANICHCSTYYFSRQFHDVVGMSFRNYVALKRTEIAKHMLLTQPNEKIAVIAYQCGFRDEAYFTRLFKKKVGMTPSGFRQKYLQSN